MEEGLTGMAAHSPVRLPGGFVAAQDLRQFCQADGALVQAAALLRADLQQVAEDVVALLPRVGMDGLVRLQLLEEHGHQGLCIQAASLQGFLQGPGRAGGAPSEARLGNRAL